MKNTSSIHFNDIDASLISSKVDNAVIFHK